MPRSKSKTNFIIEGKLYDKGEKGTMQAFQVRVQDDSQKRRVLEDIRTRMTEQNLWAG